MQLTVPFLLGVDEVVDGNPIQRIAVAAGAIEGTLSSFARDKTRGWLFQPADGSGPLITVAPKTKLDKLPSSYGRVLSANLKDAAAAVVDLSAGMWSFSRSESAAVFGAGYAWASRPLEGELSSLRARVEQQDFVAQRVITMTPAERREFDALMKWNSPAKR